MEPLKIPAKYDRCGIKIKCLHCKWQLGNGKCYEDKYNPKGINKCNHKEKHRFNMVVCVPNTTNSRKMKILETRDFNTALVEVTKFKEQLKIGGYQNVIVKTVSKTTLVEFAIGYLDAMSGINTPEHLIRKRSKNHIDECRRVIERFYKALKKKKYNLEILDLKDLTDVEVEIFHHYLLSDLKLGKISYNKHFVIMKAFVNWVIEVKDYKVPNPFRHAELTFDKKENNIITKDEFEKLLTVITYENGFHEVSNTKRNLYCDWLPNAFKLGLETGLRKEELVCLKWSNMKEINGVLIFEIDNLKVNRIQTGNDKGKHIKTLPITKSLMKLLTEIGYEEKKYKDEYVLNRPKELKLEYVMVVIARAFGHYIKLVTDRKLEFKNLRKTYITHLTMALGDKAKLFTGHTNDEVLKQHYLSSAYLAGGLSEFNMF